MCLATKNLERSRMLHVQFLNLYGGINLIIWIDTVTRDADCQPRIGVFRNLGLQIPERSTDIIFGIVQTSDQIIYGRIYIGRWSSHADLPLPALMDFSLQHGHVVLNGDETNTYGPCRPPMKYIAEHRWAAASWPRLASGSGKSRRGDRVVAKMGNNRTRRD